MFLIFDEQGGKPRAIPKDHKLHELHGLAKDLESAWNNDGGVLMTYCPESKRPMFFRAARGAAAHRAYRQESHIHTLVNLVLLSGCQSRGRAYWNWTILQGLRPVAHHVKIPRVIYTHGVQITTPA